MKTLLGTLIGVALLSAAPVHASCAAPTPDEETALKQALQTSPVVFVGTARENGPVVDVTVKDVWRGAPLGKSVEVRGGAEPPGPVSSVDRSFVKDSTYLFVLQGGPPYEDNACSMTREWRPDMAALRSIATAGDQPATTSAPGSRRSPWIWVALAMLAVGGATTFVLRARARRPAVDELSG